MKAKNGRQDLCVRGRPRPPARGIGCSQNRPRPRHPNLCLARRQSRGAKALNSTLTWPNISKPGELERLCSPDFHFKKVNNRFKKLGL